MADDAEPSSAAHAAPNVPPDSVRRARMRVLALLGALVLWCVVWELWLAPTGRGTLALKALPLAACLPGVWRHRLYTHRVLSLLVWLYAAEGAARAFTETGTSRTMAAGELLLALALFTGVVHYVRLRLPRTPRAARHASSAAPSEAPR